MLGLVVVVAVLGQSPDAKVKTSVAETPGVPPGLYEEPKPNETAEEFAARMDRHRAALAAAAETQRVEAEAARRKLEEEARVRLEADAAQRASEELRRKDPDHRAVVLSAWICRQQMLSQWSRQAIADEKRKARIAGVQNLRVLNEAGETIVEAEREIGWAKSILKSLRRSAKKCSDGEVERRIGCFENDGQCESVQLYNDARGVLWSLNQ